MRGWHGHSGEQIRHGEAAGDKSQKNDRQNKTCGVRNSAEQRDREKGHQESSNGKDGKEAERACREDGDGVTEGEANPYGKRTLRADNRHGKQDQGSGVDENGEESGKREEGGQVGEENGAQGERQGNEVRVVASIEEERVPTPESGGSGDSQGKHDEEIFVGHRGRVRVENEMAAQVANQRAVFFKHQKRDQDAGHGEHDYEHADAEVQFAGAGLAASVEHAGDEQAQKAA